MKIIATSIVVLAAAASAGESKLRLGRNLKRGNQAPGNGNKPDKANGKALGYGSRCCRDFTNGDSCTALYTADNITDACETDGLGVSDAEFAAGFNGCDWVNVTTADDLDDVFECEYAGDDDDRRLERELAPGGKGKGNGKAKGIGYHCCRPANDAGSDVCEGLDTYGKAEAYDTGCADNVAEADFNMCVWIDGVDGEEGKCDHVDASSDEEV